MGKKITIKTQVPIEFAVELAKVFNRMAFNMDPINKIIMQVIEDNYQTKTPEEIRWILKNKHQINRQGVTLINMAKKIGIQLKK